MSHPSLQNLQIWTDAAQMLKHNDETQCCFPNKNNKTPHRSSQKSHLCEVVLIMSNCFFHMSVGNCGKAEQKCTCQLQHKNNRECIKIATTDKNQILLGKPTVWNDEAVLTISLCLTNLSAEIDAESGCVQSFACEWEHVCPPHCLEEKNNRREKTKKKKLWDSCSVVLR